MRFQITTDMIMALEPCVLWPRARVERALASVDCSSWSALFDAVSSRPATKLQRVLGCSVADITDMRWLLCHAAAAHAPEVLTSWVVYAAQKRVEFAAARWPYAGAAVAAIWDRIERWRGDLDEIRAIRAAAKTLLDFTVREPGSVHEARLAAAADAEFIVFVLIAVVSTITADDISDDPAFVADEVDMAIFNLFAGCKGTHTGVTVLRDLARRLDEAQS